MKALIIKLWLPLWLLLLTACASAPPTAPSLVDSLEKNQWLGISPASRFNLRSFAIKQDPRFKEIMVPYFNQRGVDQLSEIERLVRLDLKNIDQALTILFNENHSDILTRLLKGSDIGIDLDLQGQRIDHVGRELFGPISVYLQLLTEQAPALGLTHNPYPAGKGVSPEGNLVFPSVSVVEVLRKDDPSVKALTIGKIFFTIKGDISTRAGLELFQSSEVNNQNPQILEATLQRQANLVMSPAFLSEQAKKIKPVEPIAHLAVALPTRQQVYEAHKAFMKQKSRVMKLCQEQVAYNPGDNSTITKIAIREDSPGSPFNRILEFISYQ